jgi:hypothetical protein
MLHSNTHQALNNLRPGSEVSITGENYADIIVHDATELPTEAELNTEALRLEARQVVLDEINRLEGLETQRRMAEAVLSPEGKAWLQTNRDAIAVERAKL